MGFTLNQLEQERQIRKLQKKEDKDTKDYDQLSNLPKINNVELKGDKTTSDLGINADNVMLSDGVTSVEDALDAVTERIARHSYDGQFITFNNYTDDNPFIAPTDGYARVGNGSLRIGTSATNVALISLGANQTASVFVKKGTPLYIVPDTQGPASAYFIKLV